MWGIILKTGDLSAVKPLNRQQPGTGTRAQNDQCNLSLHGFGLRPPPWCETSLLMQLVFFQHCCMNSVSYTAESDRVPLALSDIFVTIAHNVCGRWPRMHLCSLQPPSAQLTHHTENSNSRCCSFPDGPLNWQVFANKTAIRTWLAHIRLLDGLQLNAALTTAAPSVRTERSRATCPLRRTRLFTQLWRSPSPPTAMFILFSSLEISL